MSYSFQKCEYPLFILGTPKQFAVKPPHTTSATECLKLLTLCVQMEFLIKFDTSKSRWSIVYMKGSEVIIFNIYHFSFPVLAKSSDPD